MATELTPGSLNTICTEALGLAYSDYPELGTICQLAFNTGLRMVECLDVSRFAWFGENYIDCSLAKSSGVRRFHKAQIPKEFKTWMDKGEIPAIWSYSSINHTLSKYFPIIRFEESGQRLVSHLFRHNFARQKYEQGNTVEQVREIMKHSNTAVTSGYIFSPLFRW